MSRKPEAQGRKMARAKDWITKNRDALTIALISLSATTAATILIEGGDPVWIVIISNLAMLGVILLQRASIGRAIDRLQDIVVYQLDQPWAETQYAQRKKRFAEEKNLLAGSLVEIVLPQLCDDVWKEKGERPVVRIILDSGTTITPVFEQFVRKGLRLDDGKYLKAELYTNNLAGIDEVQKLDYVAGKKFSEDDFVLLGGTPLSRYRATTGVVTLDTLKNVFEKKQGENSDAIAIGVLTANWLLCGRTHDCISLCARGRGHTDFKRLVVEQSDYLVVVAPLGKIVALDDAERLNEILSKYESLKPEHGGKYESIKIEETNKKRTLLLTTSRPPGSSPLVEMSHQISNKLDGQRKNFTLCRKCPEYSPIGSEDEVKDRELPHPWTRKHTRELW